MRVISGKYRGKKLLCPEGLKTRPTTDRVKEAMFGAIQFNILNANVLDLFAGTGALGIEALSRRAKSCVFVEKDRMSVDALNKNLEKIEDDYKIIACDYLSALSSLNSEKFDLVFLDPPYEAGFYKNAMEFLFENDMIEKDGIVVVETLTGMDTKIRDTFSLYKEKKYGGISLEFYKKEEK
jgi:16S rRNA (guanine966-N2)-methyltransferase